VTPILDDYLSHDYSVLAETSVSGTFPGCRLGLSVPFTDGSRFTCGQTTAQVGSASRVYILGRLGAPPSVVVIGSHAYDGLLDQLGPRVFARAVPTNADPPTTTATAAELDPYKIRLAPLTGTQSINVLQAEASKRLNEAEADALPLHAPVPHK
jgi:hypothetical protein